MANTTRGIVKVDGQRLRKLRDEELRLSQQELAEMAGLSVSTVSRVERRGESGIHGKNFRRLAEALKVDVKELARMLAVPGSKPPEDERFPSGIGRVYPAQFVPQFEGGIAASRAEDVGERKPIRLIPAPVDGRTFAVAVDGECMLPAFAHGEVVVFSLDAIERSGLADGDPCYVQLADGRGTFKLVYRDTEDTDRWVLRCLNSRKFPDVIRVHRDEVVRVAKAVGKWAPLAAHPPKSDPKPKRGK